MARLCASRWRCLAVPYPQRQVRLGPGREVFVGLPVRTWSCASKYGWASVPFVYVTYQFGPFRHQVALPWGPLDDELILHIPDGPHTGPGPGSVCATANPAGRGP